MGCSFCLCADSWHRVNQIMLYFSILKISARQIAAYSGDKTVRTNITRPRGSKLDTLTGEKNRLICAFTGDSEVRYLLTEKRHTQNSLGTMSYLSHRRMCYNVKPWKHFCLSDLATSKLRWLMTSLKRNKRYNVIEEDCSALKNKVITLPSETCSVRWTIFLNSEANLLPASLLASGDCT